MFDSIRRPGPTGDHFASATVARFAATALIALVAAGALSGCSHSHGELVVDDTVGVTALRSPCPVVEIPEMTGDVTVLAPGRTDAGAIDLVAAISNVRSTCDSAAMRPQLRTDVTYDVVVRRSDNRGARHVDLPVFTVIQRGGGAVLSKHVATVPVDFADGQDRVLVQATAQSTIDRHEATLPYSIRQRLTKKRKSGDSDAAVDPLSQPDVRDALAKATFEMLVGFQLTEKQLAYNATR